MLPPHFEKNQREAEVLLFAVESRARTIEYKKRKVRFGPSLKKIYRAKLFIKNEMDAF